MSLYHLDDFNTFIATFKAATLHDQWHARIAKVGGKFFAALGQQGGLWQDQLIFKTTPESYAIMLEQDGIQRAPYTSGNWPSVHRHSLLSDDDLKKYIAQSYAIVSKSLTRKKREELGLF